MDGEIVYRTVDTIINRTYSVDVIDIYGHKLEIRELESRVTNRHFILVIYKNYELMNLDEKVQVVSEYSYVKKRKEYKIDNPITIILKINEQYPELAQFTDEINNEVTKRLLML